MSNISPNKTAGIWGSSNLKTNGGALNTALIITLIFGFLFFKPKPQPYAEYERETAD